MNKSFREINKEVTEYTRENRKEQEKILDQQKENSEFIGVVRNRTVEEFPKLFHKKAEVERMTSKAILQNDVIKIAFEPKYSNKQVIQVTTHKLLTCALYELTKQNNKNSKEINNKIYIPLEEYAAACGYSKDDGFRNLRKLVNKDLRVLYDANITIKETIKNQVRDYVDMRLVTQKGIKRGCIYIKFDDEVAKSLIDQGIITQYPKTLFKIDGRHRAAYSLALKMIEQYSNINNHLSKSKNYNKLSVDSLLKQVGISTDTKACKKKGWRTAAQEPLENALEYLVQIGYLSDYHYKSHEALSDDQLVDWTTCAQWKKDIIVFELAKENELSNITQKAIQRRKENKKKNEKKRKSSGTV